MKKKITIQKIRSALYQSAKFLVYGNSIQREIVLFVVLVTTVPLLIFFDIIIMVAGFIRIGFLFLCLFALGYGCFIYLWKPEQEAPEQEAPNVQPIIKVYSYKRFLFWFLVWWLVAFISFKVPSDIFVPPMSDEFAAWFSFVTIYFSFGLYWIITYKVRQLGISVGMGLIYFVLILFALFVLIVFRLYLIT